jgi:hypothetical protein
MRQSRFTHCCIQSVMSERVLVGNPPQFAGDELAISRKESHRPRSLVQRSGILFKHLRSNSVDMLASLCAHLILKRAQDVYRGLALAAACGRLRCLNLARECMHSRCHRCR